MKKVLIIRGGAIGDFVMTLPIFEAVHCEWPEAEIEVLGYAGIAELAVGRRHATAVRRVDAPEWAPIFSAGGMPAQGEREYLSRFDLAICVWPDADGVICENIKRAGAREVMAVNPMPPEGSAEHAVDFMARQCERAGLRVKFREPQLFPSGRDALWAEAFMRVTCAGERRLLALHVGSGSRRKNWPARCYGELAGWWIGRRAGHVLATGGPADEEALAEFESACGEEGVFTLREESLPRVAACLARCEAVVGNDSGVMHMAAAVRVPTVTLFGPTDPRVWRPYSSKGAVVTPASGSDMGQITVREVIHCLKRLLRRA